MLVQTGLILGLRPDNERRCYFVIMISEASKYHLTLSALNVASCHKRSFCLPKIRWKWTYIYTYIFMKNTNKCIYQTEPPVVIQSKYQHFLSRVCASENVVCNRVAIIFHLWYVLTSHILLRLSRNGVIFYLMDRLKHLSWNVIARINVTSQIDCSTAHIVLSIAWHKNTAD